MTYQESHWNDNSIAEDDISIEKELPEDKYMTINDINIVR